MVLNHNKLHRPLHDVGPDTILSTLSLCVCNAVFNSEYTKCVSCHDHLAWSGFKFAVLVTDIHVCTHSLRSGGAPSTPGKHYYNHPQFYVYLYFLFLRIGNIEETSTEHPVGTCTQTSTNMVYTEGSILPNSNPCMHEYQLHQLLSLEQWKVYMVRICSYVI